MPPRSLIRLAVLAGALVLGAFLRLRGLAGLPLFGDEYHTLPAADTSYATIWTTFDGVGSHVALPFLQRLSLDLFGAGIVPFRLVAIVPGLLTLLLAYPLLRGAVGKDAAALATCLLAVNPMHVYYSRFARGYALALWLALVLGWALLRTLEPARRNRWSWGALIASAALLPWVHLSTLGFVVAVALTGVALALRQSRQLAARLLCAFALAGAIAFLLFLPVLGQVATYFRVMEHEDPPLSWLGVPTLIAGGRGPAWAWLLLLPLGGLALWRERRHTVAFTCAALLGPLALLLATAPRGMDYAWARYLMSALPFLAALVAAAFLSGARFLPRAAEPSLLVAGAALCLLQHRCGPLSPRAPRDGSFSNTYLAMHRLEPFDEPYPAAPEFYRTLARDPAARRIVEAAPLVTRAVLAYRNYALIHGKEVRIGWTFGEMPRGIRNGPYVRLAEVGASDVDYIVLHRDQTTEVPAYFRFVYDEAWPRLRDPHDDTFMRRQESVYPQNLRGREVTDPLAAKLRELHGAAFYEDERILVWKLAP